jgi:N-acetyl-1-D-myo-inositol-2-amino-2-deoxy-alpha-D-glucopyranoside deacetylase
MTKYFRKVFMTKDKILVFFGAHPDDETFGIGRTLAHYASSGVKVYVVCSTRGEAGTVDAQYMKGYTTIGDVRWAEMKCAADVLGLAGVFHLGFRDSGMTGPATDTLVTAPVEVVAGQVVKILRELKPDVVITHDPGGSYGHRDHVATHNAVVSAFYVANDPRQYPEAGPPFQPKKLYFGVRRRAFMKVMVKLMPLFGQDPRHFGRNKDIDITRMFENKYPVHAVIRLKKQAVETRNKASACHASQGGGRMSRLGPMSALRFVEKIQGQRDYFMRDYPPPTRHREKDLFEGIQK